MKPDIDDIRQLHASWATAEAAADAAALDDLAVDDFALVGPAGFVLDKQQWLGRYRSGALRHSKFEWSEEALRLYGEAAIALGRQAQRATYNGHPADGQFRTTHVWVCQHDRWRLAAIHLSPISAPPS
jgi:ketosteroid isomerase-like protein